MKHAFAALALLTACTSFDEPEVGDGVAYSRPPVEPSCDTWGCGANSATVGDGLIFDALDVSGKYPNRGGLTLVGAVARNGAPIRLHSYGATLYGTLISDSSITYQGDQLEGTVLTLKHPDKGRYEVRIEHFKPNDLRYWAGDVEAVPFFELKTRKAGVGKFEEYACRAELTSDPQWTGVEHAAILFSGDFYDVDAMRVEDRPLDDTWLNIACAATVPAKLHLTRHTNASSTSYWHTYPTDWKQRTAMLKMFVADYCGNGHSFTVDGVPLVYQDQYHRMPTTPYSQLEALWTVYGAKCLDTTRRPIPREDISAACGFEIPYCKSTDGWDGDFGWAHALSGLP